MVTYCMVVIYRSPIWNADTVSFYDIAFLGIGMLVSILGPSFILVFLDYIAFRIDQRRWRRKSNKSILGYAGGWEIQSALDHVRIPALNEDQFPDEEHSFDKTKEET